MILPHALHNFKKSTYVPIPDKGGPSRTIMNSLVPLRDAYILGADCIVTDEWEHYHKLCEKALRRFREKYGSIVHFRHKDVFAMLYTPKRKSPYDTYRSLSDKEIIGEYRVQYQATNRWNLVSKRAPLFTIIEHPDKAKRAEARIMGDQRPVSVIPGDYKKCAQNFMELMDILDRKVTRTIKSVSYKPLFTRDVEALENGSTTFTGATKHTDDQSKLPSTDSLVSARVPGGSRYRAV